MREHRGTLLALDCSTQAMTIAILDAYKLLGESSLRAERNHSTYIIPYVQQLLVSLGMKLADIDAIVVGNGPGSYTGVRIAATAAKTFAWALKIPLIGVSSLEALAYGAHHQDEQRQSGQQQGIHQEGGERDGQKYGQRLDGENDGQKYEWRQDGKNDGQKFEQRQDGENDGQKYEWRQDGKNDGQKFEQRQKGVQWIVPLMDARRGQVYTSLYAAWGQDWTCFMADAIRLMHDWLLMLTEMAVKDKINSILFVGDVECYKTTIEQMSRTVADRWNGSVHAMNHEFRAYDIGVLGRKRWILGQQDEVHNFIPNYTQLTEAETKLLLKQS